MKTVVLDLDEVCSRTRPRFIQEINNRHGLSISNSRLYNRYIDIPEIKNEYIDEVEQYIKENPSIYADMTPIAGSAEATQILNPEYEIKIVSNRFSSDWLSPKVRDAVFEETKDWLDKHQYRYDDIVYPVPERKVDVDGDIHIDDRPEHITDATDRGRLGILFMRPHNFRDTPRGCWNAKEHSNFQSNELVQNASDQWDIITKYLQAEQTESN